MQGFGFEEDPAENKMVIKKVDADLIKKGVDLLKSFL